MENKSTETGSNNAPDLQDSMLEQYIVGIGASAGGLEAIHEFFDNIPPTTNMSFIIVQHLSPDYKSMMSELLTRHTKMKVFEAEDEMKVIPNCIYLIPNKKTITIKNGRLKLTGKSLEPGPNFAIDLFLNSLAIDKGNKAIAIILSGTGTDGSRSIELIKKEGGMVIVQDPVTAKFDGMPNSAIGTSNADYILSPELMPEEIFNFIKQKELGEIPQIFSPNEEKYLVELLSLIKHRTPFDFTNYKRPTITRRIAKRMTMQKINTLKEYYEFLKDNTEEADILCKEFLIGVTKFFRDEEAYDIIKQKVLPNLVKQKDYSDPLKLWVAGCSTGEEAYSLAILIREELKSQKRELDIKIFATDIDKEAIEYAAKGCYPASIEKDISRERLEQFFTKEGDKYRANPSLRKSVIFAHHDLIKDPPFSKIDFISCRNLLIYLNPILQKKILSTFHFALNVSGYFFMGPSENNGEMKSSFEEVSKKWKIYKNIQAPRWKGWDSIGGSGLALKVPEERIKRPQIGSYTNLSDALNEALYEDQQYAGIFVDENLELMHAEGNFKDFIQFTDKKLNLNFLKILPIDLATTLSTPLKTVIKTKEKLVINGIRVRQDNKIRNVNVVIKPYLKESKSQKFILILLRESLPIEIPSPTVPENPTHPTEYGQQWLTDIQQELKDTKENLQSAIEELETSNEELQSANEEMLSANEELQSTNEELQSLNEELHTINSEYQLKIKELIELNDDMNNYFRSSDVSQIFLDRNLYIRKYTPSATKHINLIESDIGRSITHISNNLKFENLIEEIREVIDKSYTVEREIQLFDGRWYQMKILPYVRQDKRTDGVIVTFFEITNLKKLNNIVSGVLNSSLSGIIAFKSIRDGANNNYKIKDFEIIKFNDASQRILGIAYTELFQKGLLQAMPEHRTNGLFEKYVQVVETGDPAHFVHTYEQDGQEKYLEIVAVKMEDGFTITFFDITEKKNAENKLRVTNEELRKAQETLKRLNYDLEKRVLERTRELSLREELFRLVSLATNDAIWDWDLAGNKVKWNDAFFQLFDYKEGEIEEGIESKYNRIHPEERQKTIKNINDFFQSGENLWSAEYRFQCADGTYAFIRDRGYLLRDENNIPYRMLGSIIDLSNLKKTQDELNKSNEELKRINADMDNFIYTASHDLKAPISNIEGLINTFGEIIDTEDPEIAPVIEMINTSISKFKTTIRDLTEITKLQKEKEDDVDFVDIPEILEEVKLSIKLIIVNSKTTINTNFEVQKIRFSVKHLRSIIYNLISNAIKYSHPKRTPHINISTYTSNDFIVLCIQDNGLGMETENRNKIFSMFKRLHDHVEGSGVGLYIVKKIIDNAGGRIEVDSKVGEGSIFRVYFKNL